MSNKIYVVELTENPKTDTQDWSDNKYEYIIVKTLENNKNIDIILPLIKHNNVLLSSKILELVQQKQYPSKDIETRIYWHPGLPDLYGILSRPKESFINE